jgi:hypothetical protein
LRFFDVIDVLHGFAGRLAVFDLTRPLKQPSPALVLRLAPFAGAAGAQVLQADTAADQDV